ncbi:MAG: beta-glucosidase [Kiritimatiellales bacterium]|nr:beta-glucosidase [Kiritimatiellota bacterium]MBL7011939.1 beta-glucosidase [Kiritimatiellales bacterium]
MGFSKDFLWGAATAAYQIEGAAYEDGKGLSIWDEFCKQPGRIQNGDTGDVACDHLHRYKDDVALMGELGLKAYRFSISWPRVIPQGTGAVNEAGLDFYDRLVDELLTKNIQPCATLYHWDLPQALQERGGWQSAESPEWFAEYADLMGRRLGDRVPMWFTFNEMTVVVNMASQMGVHAPGLKLNAGDALNLLKNLQLSHGRAVQVLREVLPSEAQIGLAHCGEVHLPKSDAPADVETARFAMFEMQGLYSETSAHSLYLDPILKGKPVAWAREYFGEGAPEFSEAELELISQPIDFLGLNLYQGGQVVDGPDGRPVPDPTWKSLGRTLFDWVVTPEILYWASRFCYERYQLPIIISENGMSSHDWVALDGGVHDGARIDFLHRYLRELRRAADEGVPVLGYLQWSLLDNFEWAEGYKQRFGLIHVDYETQKRTLKDSALWYKKVIASNGEDL